MHSILNSIFLPKPNAKAEQILSSDTFSLSGENRGDIFFIVKLNGLDTVLSK